MKSKDYGRIEISITYSGLRPGEIGRAFIEYLRGEENHIRLLDLSEDSMLTKNNRNDRLN